MHAPLILLSCLLSLIVATSASAVSMAWTPIEDSGNPCDTQPFQGCFGSVGYTYSIGTYEVTNAQYAEFLNAKATSDPLGLYNSNMALTYGGITRTGSDGSYTYSTIAGRANMPVNYVTFYDALRFTNWMNNGQGTGSTETGAYTLLGGTATPSNGGTVTRNGGATIALTSEDEWYKAAYYDAFTTSFLDYPAGSNAQTVCAGPTATANRANCNASNVTSVGSYTGSPSPYGTFDQGGNVWEWNERITFDNTFGTPLRGIRGGAFNQDAEALAAEFRPAQYLTYEDANTGFRLVLVPEPGTGLLVIAGLLGLAGWRRASA